MSIVIMVRQGIRGSCPLELEGSLFEKEGRLVKIANLAMDGYELENNPFSYSSVMMDFASNVQTETVTVQ